MDADTVGLIIVSLVVASVGGCLVWYGYDLQVISEGEEKIYIGQEFEGYKFKGIIAAYGRDTVVIQYDGEEYYVQQGSWVRMNPDAHFLVQLQEVNYIVIKWG